MEWILLVILGLMAGTLGSLMGLGGGILIVPALLMFSDYFTSFSSMTPQVAVGTSLLMMIFTALSSTLAYVKQRKVDYKSGLLFFIGSGPGALFGVWLNQHLTTDPFLLLFGAFMILMSFFMLIRQRLKPLKLSVRGIQRSYTDDAGATYHYGYPRTLAIMISFIVGMVSGLFGIGGGALMVPAMVLIFRFPPHIAVATSMFMIFLSSIVSTFSHIQLGNVNWVYAMLLVPGAWIGGKLGAAINQRLSSDHLVFVFRIFLIIIGIRLIYQGGTSL
ncbi:sulfite exporter TauE/SafE family protein [Texcoconibacillus texcoconensis]|uniref:Probable membrane transporter protein n=1 Tax=Texcoconibacillus texcoconensis TaxID=1095777 RepID=A0A840QQ69_9BACI|nr:sulfite exporter TauE/SafE family protein [Texcoconibacillus texcoconensis]MBB5173524.1 hypothetical protein [Texcoconibacillus texcoconensis]